MADLRAAITALPTQQRAVLTFYHYEGLSRRQIADVLDLTEPAVSRIRAQALRRLRRVLVPKQQSPA